MNFPVPWRSLLPVDAVTAVTGTDGRMLREIVDATGAGVDISADGETPTTLSDKICTVSGSVEQKEAACRRIVDKLRGMQDVADQEPGVFVIIVPSCAAPVVVGQRGAQIKEVIELSGAEISVGKENIIGMLDQPIGITGTGGQVVSAVSKINAILQDLADRGRLQPSDFKYRPGATASSLGMGDGGGGGPRGPAPSGGNPRTHAKFVAPTQVAGWIIGKQGRHIRELQENSGAHIQVMKEGEVPPGVSPLDRVIEIGGRFEAKAEGIQIVLMAIDSMPALQAPRETQMLIPNALSKESEVKDVQQMSGAELEVRDLPGHDESLCTVLGTIEARVKAAQQFLTRLEEVVADGSAFGAADSASYRSSANDRGPASQPISRESAPAPSFGGGGASREANRSEDPWSRGDPWSQGKPNPPPGRREPEVREPAREPYREPARETPAPARDPAPTVRDPPGLAATSSSMGSSAPNGGARNESGAAGRSVSFGDPEVVTFNATSGSPSTSVGSREELQRSNESSDSRRSFGPSDGGRSQGFGGSGPGAGFNAPSEKTTTTFSASGGGGTQMSFSPESRGSAGGGGANPSQTSFAPSGGGAKPSQTSFAPSGAASGTPSQTSFAPSGSASGTPSQMSFTPSGGMGGGSSASTAPGTSFGPSGGGSGMQSFGMGCGGDGMGMMGSMGAGGMGMGMFNPMMGMGMGFGISHNEAAFCQALQSQGMQSQLLLLFPQDLLEKALIPKGDLAAIAGRCQIRIDLGDHVAPNMRQVALSGTIAANAMAAYFLQEKSSQYGTGP